MKIVWPILCCQWVMRACKLVLQRLIANENTLDLSALRSGIYVVQFDNKKFNSLKIVKH